MSQKQPEKSPKTARKAGAKNQPKKVDATKLPAEERHKLALAKRGLDLEALQAKRGRKSLFRGYMYDEGSKLAAMGLTMKEIADFWNVDRSTLNRWAKRKPEFRATLKKAKLQADTAVERSLFKRAVGYKYTEVHWKEVVITEGPRAGEVVRYKDKEVEKEVVPDTTAQIYFLKNRRPDKWRDRTEQAIFGDEKLPPIRFVRVMENEKPAEKKPKEAKP